MAAPFIAFTRSVRHLSCQRFRVADVGDWSYCELGNSYTFSTEARNVTAHDEIGPLFWYGLAEGKCDSEPVTVLRERGNDRRSSLKRTGTV
jgi:hypothetical protein